MSRWLRPLLILGAALVAVYDLRPHGLVTTSADRPAAPATADDGGVGRKTVARDATARDDASNLPPEALVTLAAIARGGPFEYQRDGVIFQNREGRLPARPRGYYREYTVTTPGSGDRGARRIVAGGEPPEVFYYSDDHYASFRRIEEPLP